MPSWLVEGLKLLGLGAPVVYAAGVYGFFHLLDKKASGPAKKAISSWLKQGLIDKAMVIVALIELFDRVYTHPLLTWRAFARSSLISLTLLVILFLYIFGIAAFAHVHDYQTMIFEFELFVAFNVICDYLSLFVVRRWLVVIGEKPIFALLFGPLIGMLVIIFMIYLRDMIIMLFISERWDPPIISFSIVWLQMMMAMLDTASLNRFMIVLASVVHVWLPLVAVSAIILRIVGYLLRAAGHVQWFLKQGERHPLEAIGFVAATLVFATTAAAQHF